MQPEAEDKHCRICGHAGAADLYDAREMVFGTRAEFKYFECAECGCVQIEAIPEDLGQFYPSEYFSFHPYHSLSRDPLRRWVDPRRVRHLFGAADPIGRLAEKVSKRLDYVDWLKRAGLGLEARVLDVGCGTGKTLICMALGGIKVCEGLDPFIEHDLDYSCGAKVHKASLADFAARESRRFDLIMFHHSLEHVVDPLADLERAASLLAPDGRILIAVPVAGYAWREYRADWVNLDAPRHLHLLTAKSMGVLAGKAGLQIRDTVCHGTIYQFISSERYRRGIDGLDRTPYRKQFRREELDRFARLTAELNATGAGDQMTFYLSR